MECRQLGGLRSVSYGSVVVVLRLLVGSGAPVDLPLQSKKLRRALTSGSLELCHSDRVNVGGPRCENIGERA